MTEKQKNIVTTALKLFAEKGYDATSTSLVAKNANVSEGLIFRHFNNKEGLLHAILDLGKKDLEPMYEQLVSIEDPKERIRSIILQLSDVTPAQKQFWKLVYAMKWQAEIYDDTLSAPFKIALTASFKKLKYKNPELEAELLLAMLDGIITTMLLKKPKNMNDIIHLLLTKYNL